MSVSPTLVKSGTPVSVTMSPARAAGRSRGTRETPTVANTPDTCDVGPLLPPPLDSSAASSSWRRSSARASPEDAAPE